MDNENRTPQNTNTSEATFSHSGSSIVPESMREQPVHEFPQELHEVVGEGEDKPVSPTLPEGVTTGHFEEQTTKYSSLTAEAETSDDKAPKVGVMQKIGNWIFHTTSGRVTAGVATVAAGVAVVAAVASGPKSSDNKGSGPVATDVAHTPEATPTNTPSTGEKEISPASIEIPAGLSPEQLGVTLIQDRLSQWEMAGATDANTDTWSNKQGSDAKDAYTLELADKNATTFADSLFIDNWESEPSLKQFKKIEHDINLQSVEYFFKTNHTTASQKAEFPTDFEAYKRTVTVDPADVTVVSQDADSITLAIIATEHDNKDRNRVGNELSNGNPAQVEGEKYKATVTLKNVNGVEKVASYSITNP